MVLNIMEANFGVVDVPESGPKWHHNVLKFHYLPKYIHESHNVERACIGI